jgi:MFS family permease
MKNNTKITLINNIGAVLEYYDYIIYALLTEYLSHIFFPTEDPSTAVLKTILIFIMGAIARIFGSVIFGLISDKLSRKFNLLTSISFMAVTTLGIGLLPGYNSIGIYAPILLTLFRFLQGLAYCAEIPSTAVFLSEYQTNSKGIKIAMLISSTTLGAILATFVMYLITTLYSFNEIVDYVWRVPFLFGGCIGILGYFARTQIPDTKVNKEQSTPLTKQFILSNLFKVIQATFMILLPACLIINNLYFPSMLSNFYGYTQEKIYFFSTISLIFSALISPIYGAIIDRFNPQALIKYLGGLFITTYILFNYGLFVQNNWYLLLFLLIHQFFLTGMINAALAILTSMFDNQLKCTITTICYNLAFIIAGASPFIIRYFEMHLLISVIPVVICLVMLCTPGLLNSSNRNEKFIRRKMSDE